MTRQAPDAPVLLVHWEHVVGEVLDRTSRIPKSARFTFAARIDTLALDILERLVSARYAAPPRRRVLLAEADDALARLRVLLRLCHTRKFLDTTGFEHLCRLVDEAGRMLGGWRASLRPAE